MILLGHSDIGVTLNVYTHLGLIDAKEEMNRIEDYRKMPVNSVNTAFQGVLSNDKSVIRLPRHSSFMIMHTFADWGNTGQNMAENLGITQCH